VNKQNNSSFKTLGVRLLEFSRKNNYVLPIKLVTTQSKFLLLRHFVAQSNFPFQAHIMTFEIKQDFGNFYSSSGNSNATRRFTGFTPQIRLP
jgi:hypothetical protein